MEKNSIHPEHNDLREILNVAFRGLDPGFALDILPEIWKFPPGWIRTVTAEALLDRASLKPENPLPNASVSVSNSPVAQNFAELKARISSVTRQRGKKARLAELLGVKSSQLAQWLNTDRQPGADVTLLMLAWVQAEEAKQKSSASAQTPAEPKTRKKQNKHELPKSSPQPD